LRDVFSIFHARWGPLCAGEVGPFVGISNGGKSAVKRRGDRGRRMEEVAHARTGCFEVRGALLVFSFIMIYASREQRWEMAK